MLCNNGKLAKTSASPGKTQLINFFEITSGTRPGVQGENKWWLVDLPGYGFAHVSKSDRRRWEQMIENYLRKRASLTQVFVLVDARHPPQQLDLDFIRQLMLWQVPYTVIFTKADKEKPGVVSEHERVFLEALGQFAPFLPRLIISSAVQKTGRDQILALISEMNGEQMGK